MGRTAGFEPDVVLDTEDYQSVRGLVGTGVGLASLRTPYRTDINSAGLSEQIFCYSAV